MVQEDVLQLPLRRQEELLNNGYRKEKYYDGYEGLTKVILDSSIGEESMEIRGGFSCSCICLFSSAFLDTLPDTLEEGRHSFLSRPIPISERNRWKVRCQDCPMRSEDAIYG